MIIKDKIYGKIKITSPVILSLLKSTSLQRLKKIKHYGLPDKYNYPKKSFSRYDHSVGVMLLLKKFGASEKEQIAGLIHDVSHLAFSHVADWVFDETEKEGLQDRLFKQFILKTSIPKILERYHYQIQDFFNLEKFTLLENHSPDLCADRLDYSLKEMPVVFAKECLKNLVVLSGSLYFKNKLWAKKFALQFLALQENHWGGEEYILRYYLFAKALKQAIKLQKIKVKDFDSYDRLVLEKLEKINEPLIKKISKLLAQKKIYQKSGKFIKMSKKFRYVDPQFLIKNKLKRLSVVDMSFKKKLFKAKQDNKGGFWCPVL